jgi:hypothetical protein
MSQTSMRPLVSGRPKVSGRTIDVCAIVSSHRTDLVLAPWLGSHLAAVALQATLGMSASLAVAYLSFSRSGSSD